MEYVWADPIPDWCAGCWMSGLTEDIIEHITKEQLIKSAVAHKNSVIVVSVGEEEEEVIKKLKEWGFAKGKWFKNWGHNGKRTCLYTLQLSAKEWSSQGNTIGCFDDWY